MSKKILNKLVDKYENSTQKENIHISILLNKKIIPEYYDLNSEEYEVINKELQHEEDLRLITIDWKNNWPGHIVERVRLIPDSIDKIYEYLNRKPKSFEIEVIVNRLKEDLVNYSESNITKELISYLIERIEKGKSISEFLDLSDYNEFSKFVYVLSQLEKNKDLLYLREFSGKVSGDTKYIERNLHKFINAIYKFSDVFDTKDPELILNYFNIYRNPIFVFLKGNLKIFIDTESLNLSHLSNGIALSSQDLRNLRIDSVKNVITIENLTTYNRFPILSDSLIIYSRGFANSELIKLLELIHHQNPNCRFYHFGDIDIGGFLILLDLIQKTNINFKPLFMSEVILEKYTDQSKSLTINDKKRLKKLMEWLPRYGINKETKDYLTKSLLAIKETGTKLEQEVIDFDSNSIELLIE